MYQFAVRASDGRYYGYLDVTVEVTNLNEHPPVVTGSNRRTVREKTTSPLDTYRATDQDRGDTFTWSVSGTDGHLFDISDRGALTFRNPPDHDIPGDSGNDNQYDIEVIAKDGEGLEGSLAVTVIVTAVNEGPQVFGTSSFAIDENQDLPGASYTASDPEGTTAFRWSTSGRDGGDFTIDENGVLTFRNPPDHERPADSNRDNLYELTVRAYDGRNYGTQDVTVTVGEVNERPVNSGRNTFTYRENSTYALYAYRATDPERERERDNFTWSLGGSDAGDFDTSERGVLTFRNPPNFEFPAGPNGNEYQATVQATDELGSIGTFDVIVTVTDLNEGPTVTGRNDFTFSENRDPTLVLETYSATDPEGAGITRWSLSGSDGGDFLINETGDLTFRYTPDYDRPADSNRDNAYQFAVRAYDGRYYGTSDVTVTVTNENEHDPVVTGRDTLTVRENTTSSLYTYRATDGDRNTVILWSVTGDDQDDFDISTQGVLTFEEPPNHETPADSGGDNVYQLTVVATDDGGRKGIFEVAITVTEVNEGPEITGSSTLSVVENQAADAPLTKYSATDPESPTTPITRWSLSGSDGGDFVINELGELRFRYTPDYDRPSDSNRDNEYRVTIRASDGRYYGYFEVVVTVSNVNEHAPAVTGRNSLSFRENTTSALYSYRATDGDLDTIITWSVRGTDADDFEISNGGALSFGSPPDYELPTDADTDNVYEITVVAQDEGGMEGTFDVTITIIELNEGPDTTETFDRTVFTVDENYDSVIATFVAEDPEDPTADITRWSVSGGGRWRL